AAGDAPAHPAADRLDPVHGPPVDHEACLRAHRGLHRHTALLLVALRPQRAHGRPVPRVEHAELDAGLVGVATHLAAQRVDLLHEVALGDAADRWIAGHLRDLVLIHREQGRARAHAGRGQRSLAAGMASADYDHVEALVVLPDDHFPMQNSLKMRSRMSSVVVSPMISPIALIATRRSAAMHSAAMCRWTDTSA